MMPIEEIIERAEKACIADEYEAANAWCLLAGVVLDYERSEKPVRVIDESSLYYGSNATDVRGNPLPKRHIFTARSVHDTVCTRCGFGKYLIEVHKRDDQGSLIFAPDVSDVPK